MWSKLKTEISAFWVAYGDKVLHVGAGFIIGLVFGQIHAAAGLVAAIIAGTAKELIDMRDGGTGFDMADLTATLAGGIIGSLIAWMT